MLRDSDDYIKEIWEVSGYPIVELIERFKQGYTLTSPVEMHRNIKNCNKASALKAIIEELNQYIENLKNNFNYEYIFGTEESEERAWNCYVVARNIQIKIKDILKNYNIHL